MSRCGYRTFKLTFCEKGQFLRILPITQGAMQPKGAGHHRPPQGCEGMVDPRETGRSICNGIGINKGPKKFGSTGICHLDDP